MAKFKLSIANPLTGKSFSTEIEGNRAIQFIGKKIGDIIDGSVANQKENNFVITGGCDQSGFPMRPDVHGGKKSKILLSGGVGYKVRDKGIRKRKTVRGNTITEDITLINMISVNKEKYNKGD